MVAVEPLPRRSYTCAALDSAVVPTRCMAGVLCPSQSLPNSDAGDCESRCDATFGCRSFVSVLSTNGSSNTGRLSCFIYDRKGVRHARSNSSEPTKVVRMRRRPGGPVCGMVRARRANSDSVNSGSFWQVQS